MLDLTLAIVHHLLVFGLLAILTAEMILVRKGMDMAAVRRVGAIDLAYGVVAGLIVVAGFARAMMAAKGWSFYGHNGFFWAKVAVFVVIGLLSAPPTIAYVRWRKSGVPSDAQVTGVKRWLHAELALFPLLPVFAAAMARGYGQFG